MGSPKSFPPLLIPEFEEGEGEFSINQGKKKSKMKDSSDLLESGVLNDIKQLKLILEDLNGWGNSTFDKKKMPRIDYDEFTGICSKLAVAIERAETRYAAEENIHINLSAKIEKLEDCVNQLSTEVAKMQESAHKAPSQSYAEALQLPGKKLADHYQVRQKELKIKKTAAKQNVVIIKPREVVGTEEEARKKVIETLKHHIPKEQNLKVKKSVNVRGGGVLLVLDPSVDKHKILGDRVTSDPTLKVSEPQYTNKPRIIIYDVPSHLEKDDLAGEVYNRNLENIMSREIFSKNFTPLFKLGPRDKENVHWVVECSAELRKDLINKFKIFIDWVACRVKDFISVSRCFKCQGLGHISKSCTKEQSICAHCAVVGHDIKTCPKKKEAPTCANCKNQNKDARHNVNDKRCMSYIKAMQHQIDRTDYGF